MRIGDAVFVKSSKRPHPDAISVVLHDFLGTIHRIHEDGTMDVVDGEGNLFDSLRPSQVKATS